jgi:FkbM family methyltransferase
LGYERYLHLFSNLKIHTLRWDKNEKDFFYFLSLLDPKQGDILDIGANLGLMTYHFSKAFPETKIIAFEPEFTNLSVLKSICSRYKLNNVSIYDCALGEKEGIVRMVLPNWGKIKMQGLSHVKHESIDTWNDGEEFSVPMKTLDQLFPNTKVQAIKLDVENYEYFVLKGGENLILRNNPIIYVELWDNENRQKCFQFIQELGYQIYVLVEDALVAFIPTIHHHHNFTFLPPNFKRS